MTDGSIPPIFALVTRAEAKKEGKKRYFTGKPCRHGHICERRVIGSACIECIKIRHDPVRNYANIKSWRAKNPHKRTEEARKYRAKHPDKVRENSLRHRHRNLEIVRRREAENARKRRKADPEGNRKRLRAYKQRQEMELVEIAGRPRAMKCEVCRENGKTVFDHCHESGMFRGWICDRCNKTLGMVKDSPRILKLLARYLEANNVKTDEQRAPQSPEQGFFWSKSVLSD